MPEFIDWLNLAVNLGTRNSIQRTEALLAQSTSAIVNAEIIRQRDNAILNELVDLFALSRDLINKGSPLHGCTVLLKGKTRYIDLYQKVGSGETKLKMTEVDDKFDSLIAQILEDTSSNDKLRNQLRTLLEDFENQLDETVRTYSKKIGGLTDRLTNKSFSFDGTAHLIDLESAIADIVSLEREFQQVRMSLQDTALHIRRYFDPSEFQILGRNSQIWTTFLKSTLVTSEFSPASVGDGLRKLDDLSNKLTTTHKKYDQVRDTILSADAAVQAERERKLRRKRTLIMVTIFIILILVVILTYYFDVRKGWYE